MSHARGHRLDHAGFELKEAVKTFLAADITRSSTSGPTAGSGRLSRLRASRRRGRAGVAAERGILLCGSGVGASMVANRIPGIRAGLCHDTYSAHQGVEHDDMNVLARRAVIGIELARELRAFLNARFTGEPRSPAPPRQADRAREPPARARGLRPVRVARLHPSQPDQSGELRRLIAEDGVRGVTSNPAIFEKAVAGSSDYREMLEAPEARALDAKPLYESSPSATFRTPRRAAGRVRGDRPATATSAWRCPRSWRTTRRAR